MRRGRDFYEKPVIDVNNGKVLGYVAGFKPGKNRLEGLYLRSPEKETLFIPFSQVKSLGRDAVLVMTPVITGTVDSGAGLERTEYAGFHVMTISGENLGTIEDIIVEETDGSIKGYEVSDGLFMDVIMGRKMIPVSNIITYGDDAVIVEDIH